MEILNTTTGEHSGASHCSHKFCPNCGSKAFPSGDWWVCGTSRTEGKLNVTELCRAREEITQLKTAINDMLPIVQAVAGKGPLSDPQWNLKAFAEDVLAIYFANNPHHPRQPRLAANQTHELK